MPRGWHGESGRHSLAAKGIKTGRKLKAPQRSYDSYNEAERKAYREIQDLAFTIHQAGELELAEEVGGFSLDLSEEAFGDLQTLFEDEIGTWEEVDGETANMFRIWSDRLQRAYEELVEAEREPFDPRDYPEYPVGSLQDRYPDRFDRRGRIRGDY